MNGRNGVLLFARSQARRPWSLVVLMGWHSGRPIYRCVRPCPQDVGVSCSGCLGPLTSRLSSSKALASIFGYNFPIDPISFAHSSVCRRSIFDRPTSCRPRRTGSYKAHTMARTAAGPGWGKTSGEERRNNNPVREVWGVVREDGLEMLASWVGIRTVDADTAMLKPQIEKLKPEAKEQKRLASITHHTLPKHRGNRHDGRNAPMRHSSCGHAATTNVNTCTLVNEGRRRQLGDHVTTDQPLRFETFRLHGIWPCRVCTGFKAFGEEWCL